MSVVLKYTLAGRPCKCSDPAQRAGAAQGTHMEGTRDAGGLGNLLGRREVGGKEMVEGRVR